MPLLFMALSFDRCGVLREAAGSDWPGLIVAGRKVTRLARRDKAGLHDIARPEPGVPSGPAGTAGCEVIQRSPAVGLARMAIGWVANQTAAARKPAETSFGAIILQAGCSSRWTFAAARSAPGRASGRMVMPARRCGRMAACRTPAASAGAAEKLVSPAGFEPTAPRLGIRGRNKPAGAKRCQGIQKVTEKQ